SSQLLGSIKTNPDSLPHVKNILKNQLGFDDEDLAEIGDSYDPNNEDDVNRIDGLIDRSLTEKEKLARSKEKSDEAYRTEVNRINALKEQNQADTIAETKRKDLANEDKITNPEQLAYRAAQGDKVAQKAMDLMKQLKSTQQGSTFAERY